MTDMLRTFLRRLSPVALGDLFELLRLDVPEFEGLGPTKKTKLAADRICAVPTARGRAEAIAGEVVTLCQKGDIAEVALRNACEGRTDLIDILESDASPEERAWRVWSSDKKLIDRARNVAMTYHWRDGRYHAAFDVSHPEGLKDDLSKAVETIRSLVQEIEGGRRAYTDVFAYSNPDAAAADTEAPDTIHHVAVYLEQPASFLLEFDLADDAIQPVIRRAAKELSIVYHPARKRLDVSGAGIGGQKVLQRIAEAFCSEAIEGAALSEVKQQEYDFEFFNRKTAPKLTPPDGFQEVVVTEIRTRDRHLRSNRASFTAAEGSNAYKRIRRLRVGDALDGEYISGVTLTLPKSTETEDEVGRKVRLILNWPGGKSYDNATIEDQRVIDAWFENQAFGPLKPDLLS